MNIDFRRSQDDHVKLQSTSDLCGRLISIREPKTVSDAIQENDLFLQ